MLDSHAPGGFDRIRTTRLAERGAARRDDWPSDDERRSDLATHARVSESLRRVRARWCSRRGRGREFV